MSALGQKQTFNDVSPMSALPPKADIGYGDRHVRFVPKADIGRNWKRPPAAEFLPPCGSPFVGMQAINCWRHRPPLGQRLAGLPVVNCDQCPP